MSKLLSRIKLEKALEQLDFEIAKPEARPSIVKSLQTKIETLRDLLHFELDGRKEDLQGQLATAKAELQEFKDKLEGTSLDEVKGQTVRLAELEHENDRLNSSLHSVKSERDTSLKSIADTQKLLLFLLSRCTDASAKLRVAIASFLELGSASKPILDVLQDSTAFSAWSLATKNTETAIKTFIDRERSKEPTDHATRQLCREWLAKQGVDIDAVIVARNEAERLKNQKANTAHDERMQAADMAQNARMQEQAFADREACVEPIYTGPRVVKWGGQ